MDNISKFMWGIVVVFWVGVITVSLSSLKFVKEPKVLKQIEIYEKINDKRDTVISNLDYMSGVLAVSGATLDTNKFTRVEMYKIGAVTDSLYYKKKAENTRLRGDIEVLYRGLEE